MKFPKGLTLLETVMYVGITMMVLPFMVNFVLQVHDEQELFDSRTRMEQSAGLLFAELSQELTAADAVRTSSSTLNANPSTLRFTDANGNAVVIDRLTVAVTFPGGTQNVNRLRMQVGTAAPVYLTDGEIDVTEWKVVALRDSSNVLTGLRISMDYAMIQPGADAYRKAAFAGDTTISLSPHTVEN